jgi:hypothetical protein
MPLPALLDLVYNLFVRLMNPRLAIMSGMKPGVFGILKFVFVTGWKADEDVVGCTLGMGAIYLSISLVMYIGSVGWLV